MPFPTPGVWSLDRLRAAFPALRSEGAGGPEVASVPRAAVSGTAQVDDEDTGQQAEITLTLVPSQQFVVEFNVSLPAAGAASEELEAEIARGVF
jgi:hypothetical protein